jgi:CheY-like chemotaxis protein
VRGEHAGAPCPDLVPFDLNEPGRDGRQVLADSKADPELRRIPVVVLTASNAEEDVVRSYDLHANAYVTKPVDFQSFVHVIRNIDEFFISVVRLPPSRAKGRAAWRRSAASTTVGRTRGVGAGRLRNFLEYRS